MMQEYNISTERTEQLMKEYARMSTRLRMLRFEIRCIADSVERNKNHELFANLSSGEGKAVLIKGASDNSAKCVEEITCLEYTISVLNEAIECLEDHHRKTIKALYVNGLTYETAGRALHASKSTVNRWRKEALERMTGLLSV